jgi:hypothetical protein
MKTIQSEWQRYAEGIYPDGMTRNQEEQVRDAFIAGAGTTFKLISCDIQELPEMEAMAALTNLATEIEALAAEIIKRNLAKLRH